jgi:PLD-like domain/Helicase conserved C-terminal domain
MSDIIDNRTHHLAEQIRTNLDSSTAAHFAVGYFFLSGFTAIADKLPHIKHLRLLIGNTTNRQTIEQIAQGYQQLELIEDRLDAQTYPNHQALVTDNSKQVRSQLELMEQSDESETLVKNLVQTIESKRLEVKVYTKGVLHAKAYIFDYGDIFDGKGKKLDRSEQGIAIVGSSNLTLSGLNNNTELNVVIHGNDNHQQLTNWFDELWDVAEDFDAVLMQEMKQSWVMNIATPYDVYMKTLYHLVRDRLELAPVDIIIDPNDISKQLAEFQTRAVQNAIQNIQNYGGAFVSDVVGLGKSYIGAAIVKWMEQHERARTLIICPPPLMEMWERYNEKYHLNARVLSMGMLKSDDEHGLRTLLEDEKYKHRDFVLVDESHHLRNYGTQRYKVLQAYLAAGDKRCCFLTATPRNKSALDIYYQIKLFHQADITNIPIDPPDLKQYFQMVEKGERNLPDLLSHILIRRTRNHILRFYGLDSETNLSIATSPHINEYLSGQRKAYILVGGRHQYFPKRRLETIEYSIEDTYNGLYQQLRQYLGKSNKQKSLKTLTNTLCYARYGLGNYVLASKQQQEPYKGLQTAGANLRGLIRVLLFKRFESSVYAFQQTIDRMILAHERFLIGLNSGLIPAGKEAQDILKDDEAAGEDELDIIEALRSVSGKYDIEDFDRAKLTKHIAHDLKILKQIHQLVTPITPAQDAKLQTLKQWLAKPDILGKKQIIFTQYADTAQYLYNQITDGSDRDDIEVIHSNSGKDKGRLVQRFAPKANNNYQLKSGETELNTLIATDILAEGLNLQDGDMIINYDLHWNPVKLIQRFGRIDRIGTEKETIYGYNFLPELGIEKNLGLKEKLQHRIQEIHETIGEDSAILDNSEQLNENAMYAIYEHRDKQLDLFDLEPAPPIDLTDAEEMLRQLQQHNPDEFERIVNLPNGIRTAKLAQEAGTFVFCESSNINDPSTNRYPQLFLLDRSGEIISRDISKILSIVAAQENTPSSLLRQDHNQTVTQTLRRFSKEVKQRRSEQHSYKLNPAQKYILRELEKLFKNDTEEDLELIINELIRTIQSIHNPTIIRELKIIKDNGLTGQSLLNKLIYLYQQYDLKAQINSASEPKSDLSISKIICSSGLQGLGGN